MKKYKWKKEQKDRFVPMLLGTLATSLLGRALSGRGVTRAGERKIKAGQNL